MTPVLVSGGAGCVGSHTCMRLAMAGFLPITYDNLSSGRRDFVQWGPLEIGDIRDRARLAAVLERHRPEAVLHFAGLIDVAESVKDPASFHDNNVVGSLTLLEATRDAGVRNLVFASSCAIFGAPESLPIAEDHIQSPLNPYGETKVAIERALAEFDAACGLRSVALRYFNAAGADWNGRIGESRDPETHALPLAIGAALGERPEFKVFGEDYETRDGSALRDYIHVLDLADAHVLALQHLRNGGKSDVFNLGSGVGTTVKELVEMVQRVSGRTFPVTSSARRAGDSPALLANSSKAKVELGWRPQFDLRDIVDSAWRWHTSKDQHGRGPLRAKSSISSPR